MSKKRGSGKRWVEKEIAQLDPEVDYEKIIGLIVGYQLNEFVLNLSYAVSFMNVIQASHGSETLMHTRKVTDHQQKRFDDSLDYLVEWYVLGPSHPDVRKSITRLNRRHMALARQLPGNFADHDDFIQPLALMALFSHRLRIDVGLSGMPDNLRIAFHHWLRDLSKLFETETGPIRGFPDDFDGIVAFAEKFEDRDYPTTEHGRVAAAALVQQFAERWFPRPLWPLGRAIVLAVTPEKVRGVHGLPHPNRVAARLVRWGFRLLLGAQERFLPDSTTLISERRATGAYREQRKARAAGDTAAAARAATQA
ncbi:hypothetical protein [Streptomyces sp. GbtcB7]|uniref:hypothetical protein n=1 Tax=Streptomyces sp. GbtcB7 TaxID=2824752 RepID=UPI001C308834|nr:hypothetical protein [Streptomyces sp. GbtcB7]